MKTAPSLIFGLALVISAWFVSRTWKSNHHINEKITVKGMAKKDFTSDLIVWKGIFSRKSASMQEAYASIKNDADAVHKYLIANDISEKNVTFSAVDIDREYDEIRDKEGNVKRVFKGFELKQSVKVESSEVDKVEVVARQVTELINQGIELISESPDFYNTKLAELKLEMLSAATADARARAEKIAENAGGHLGRLKNANMGVFQITGKNEEEEYSYGGTFNTASKEKTASITVSLEYDTE